MPCWVHVKRLGGDETREREGLTFHAVTGRKRCGRPVAARHSRGRAENLDGGASEASEAWEE